MKKFYKIISGLSLVPMLAMTPVIASCQSKNYNEIKIKSKESYLEVGKSTTFIVNNGNGDPNDFNWSVEIPSEYTTEKIYITSSGLLCVADTLKLNGAIIDVKVKATLKSNSSMSAETNVPVVESHKEGSSNFLGFEGNVVHHYDAFDKPVETKIIQLSDYEYKVASPIDLFMLNEARKPDYDYITFKHIVRNDSKNTMRWYYEKPAWSPEKEILRFVNYTSGDETATCPGVEAISPVSLSDKIVIKFMCNGTQEESKIPKLTINFNIWMAKRQSTSGLFSYFPKEGDKHYITPDILPGVYKIQTFCPSSPGDYVYANNLIPIYCYKQLHEYSNYYFEFQLDTGLDERVRNAFKYQFSVAKTYREYDNFPIYQIGFWYGFDMSKMPSGKELNYATLTVGKLICWTSSEKIGNEAWLEFRISWL